MLTCSDADDSLKLAVRTTMISLVPDFIRLFSKHVDEVIGAWRPTDINNHNAFVVVTDPLHRRLHEETMKLILLVAQIAKLPASTRPALDMLNVLFRRAIPELWKSSYVKEMHFMIFDELAVLLCRQLKEAHGIQGLQDWRVKWTEQDLLIGTRRWKSEAFVLRAMQCVSEYCARDTAKLLVSKVVEGRLPVELADWIFEQTLVANFPFTPNIPNRENDWEKLVIGEARMDPTASSPYPCCPHLNCLTPHENMLWSTAERKYVRFHLTSPAGMLLSPLGMTLGPQRVNTTDGVSIDMRQPFWARCSEDAKEVGRKNYILVPDGPLPPGEGGPMCLYEIDHGVGRDWRAGKSVSTEVLEASTPA